MLKIKTKRDADGDISVSTTYSGGSSEDMLAELLAIIVGVIERLVEEHKKAGDSEAIMQEYFDLIKGFLDWYLKKGEKNE